ncbi:MAG: SNF2-related protein [Gemmatimonadaceae bacterium]|nr:SNF2-related protein [Gemmatimonadaceae bacterium]
MDRLSTLEAPLSIVHLDKARHAIAAALLGDEADRDPHATAGSLGRIRLRPHQIEAIGRLRQAIEEFGGALLGDPVGTGKTFVALALASSTERILVVAPAVLRTMWTQAALAAGRTIRLTSFESLSRGNNDVAAHDLLIVDEAHHARNPRTRRYAALARLASRGRVLLLSATPIHNRRHELTRLLSLFLGERATSLTDAELGRCVVRRAHVVGAADEAMPRIEPLRWCDQPDDDSVPRILLALPPPLPPREGGDGGALVAHSLIRQWASSNAALEGGLTRRLHRAIALTAALEDGTYPSRTELAAWSSAEDSVQLAFSSLLAPAESGTAQLLPVIRKHRHAVASLLDRIRLDRRRDDELAATIRQLRQSHHGVPIVAFSQYEDTIQALFGRLANDGEVAALSGSGARVAGGSISRGDAISRFAPVASGCPAPPRSERVSLLLTTDLLSEGVNLQDAGVIVHLDLPWTPARMEQRLGRIARIGSPYCRVFAYAMRPPANADAIVRIERILHEKMKAAATVIESFPSLMTVATDFADTSTNGPRMIESARRLISEWLNDASIGLTGAPLVAAAVAPIDGFLAACRINGQVFLFGCLDGRITDEPEMILRCARYCRGRPTRICETEASVCLDLLSAHVEAAHLLRGVKPAAAATNHVRRSALRHIAVAAARSRPHMRARVSVLAKSARNVVTGNFGSHAELELATLDSLDLSDEKWLERVIEFGSRFGAATSPRAEDAGVVVIAMIVFRCRRDAIVLSSATER